MPNVWNRSAYDLSAIQFECPLVMWAPKASRPLRSPGREWAGTWRAMEWTWSTIPGNRIVHYRDGVGGVFVKNLFCSARRAIALPNPYRSCGSAAMFAVRIPWIAFLGRVPGHRRPHERVMHERSLSVDVRRCAVARVHGYSFDNNIHSKTAAVMRAVSTLLAKNKFVVKDLRTRQPVISRIDEKLLVEVAGIERSQAKFLCSDFQSYWQPSPWGSAAQGVEHLASYLRSIWK